MSSPRYTEPLYSPPATPVVSPAFAQRMTDTLGRDGMLELGEALRSGGSVALELPAGAGDILRDLVGELPTGRLLAATARAVRCVPQCQRHTLRVRAEVARDAGMAADAARALSDLAELGPAALEARGHALFLHARAELLAVMDRAEEGDEDALRDSRERAGEVAAVLDFAEWIADTIAALRAIGTPVARRAARRLERKLDRLTGRTRSCPRARARSAPTKRRPHVALTALQPHAPPRLRGTTPTRSGGCLTAAR